MIVLLLRVFFVIACTPLWECECLLKWLTVCMGSSLHTGLRYVPLSRVNPALPACAPHVELEITWECSVLVGSYHVMAWRVLWVFLTAALILDQWGAEIISSEIGWFRSWGLSEVSTSFWWIHDLYDSRLWRCWVIFFFYLTCGILKYHLFLVSAESSNRWGPWKCVMHGQQRNI
jgi:hypothetical protein